MTTFNEVLARHREINHDLNGNIICGYDSINDTIVALSTFSDGSISFSHSVITHKRLIGIATIPTAAMEAILLEITVSKKIEVEGIIFSGNGYGEFRLFIDGVLWLSLRNSYFQRAVSVNQPITVDAGSILKMVAINETLENESNNYESFIYYKEVL